MHRWATRLRDDLGISIAASNSLATSISGDVAALPPDVQGRILPSSTVPLRRRLDEVTAFQAFMDEIRANGSSPATTRAQVIVQNYVCFVYLGESCFRVLRKNSPTGSTLNLCCRFLTDNPVRAFRNAIAHGNWDYNSDFDGLVFWARKGENPNENLSEFNVSQNELEFWQSLARCTAYAAYMTLARTGS